MHDIPGHAQKCRRLVAELAAARDGGAAVGLGKSTSNLFRHREEERKVKIDVRQFNSLICIDEQRMLADIEGMTTYETLVDETLRHGLLPSVVPQLKTITVGGAVSGLGIESSSFRYGLVHETVEEMEVLLGDGRIVTCSPSVNQDLFFGFPNSYGTLGYILRLQLRLVPAKPYVHLTHTRFSEPERFFAFVSELCEQNSVDFLDGTVFSQHEMYAITGEACCEAPRVSDYTYMQIYYRSIQKKREDWLTTKAYTWRWDTDWFWCSKQFHVQNPALRWAAKWALNSRTYHQLMRLSYRFMQSSSAMESVIQDIDIPVENAVKFLRFLLTEIGITPIWICPFRVSVSSPLYELDPARRYINFGFWDAVASTHERGYFNRKIECMTSKLEGKKSLYSTAWYDPETFWRIYNKSGYDQLKQKYDPGNAFQDLYAKCVQRK